MIQYLKPGRHPEVNRRVQPWVGGLEVSGLCPLDSQGRHGGPLYVFKSDSLV